MKKVFSGFVPGGRYRLPFIFKNSNLDFSCILVQQHQLKEEKIRSIDIFIGWAAIVPVGGNSIIIIIAPRDSESSFCILVEKRINQTQFILKIELGDDEVVFTRHQKNEVWTTFTQIDERMYNKRMRCNNITYINRNDDVVFFHVTGNNKWIWIYSALLHWRV